MRNRLLIFQQSGVFYGKPCEIFRPGIFKIRPPGYGQPSFWNVKNISPEKSKGKRSILQINNDFYAYYIKSTFLSILVINFVIHIKHKDGNPAQSSIIFWAGKSEIRISGGGISNFPALYYIKLNGQLSIIMNEYHYTHNHFARRSDCTFISFYGPVVMVRFTLSLIIVENNTRHFNVTTHAEDRPS